jgi:hypothetical protein
LDGSASRPSDQSGPRIELSLEQMSLPLEQALLSYWLGYQMSSSLSGKHYFSICFGTKGGWGHSRPELIFSFRLLRLHKHIVLTLLLPANFRDRIQKEIVTFKLNPEEQARARIAWFDVPSAPPFDINGGEEDDGRWALAADWQAAFALVPYGRLLRVSLLASPY